MHVLVAGQDQRLTAAIAKALRRDGATVDLAADGARALAMSGSTAYDVLVLEPDLPCGPAGSINKRLREGGCQTPIVGLPTAERKLSRQRNSLDRPPRESFDVDEILAQVRACNERVRGHLLD